MLELVLDFLRIGAAIVCCGIALSFLRLAWAIAKSKPTQRELQKLHGRQRLAKMFRLLGSKT